MRNQYNCGTHRAALVEGGMLTGMSRFEASKGVTLPGAATPAAEPAPPGQRQVKAARGSTLIQNATYTAAKKYGKGKEHETLTRTKAFSLCRDYAEKAKLYFECVIGPRGASAVSGNAEPTFVMMMEDDDWSMLHMLGAEDAIKKGSNRMHDSLREHQQSDVLMAELRVCGILQVVVFRPIQTFVQSNSTQADNVLVVQQYRVLILKLKEGTHPKDWTVRSDDNPDGIWLDAAKTQVLGIAASSIVLHAKTHARRVKSLGVLVTAPNINPDRREAQDAMLGECLKYAAIGMLEALDRVSGPKYVCSSIWALDPEHPRFAELRGAAGTSDYIERYFGLASWLRTMNRNQSPMNRDFVLNMKETQLATRIADHLFSDRAATTRKASSIGWRTT